MCCLFLWITLVIGFWVFISPWVLGYFSSVILGVIIFGGLLTVALSAVNIRLHQQLMALPVPVKPAFPTWHTEANVEKVKTTEDTTIIKRMRWGLVAAGIFLLAVGIWFAPSAVGWSSLGAGIVVALLSGLVTQISPLPITFTFVTSDGGMLMETSSISYADGSILLKGKVLGSLSTNAYLKPEEVWKALSLISLSVVTHLPFFLWRGWQASRRRAKELSATS
jgi:hypothetical protein